MKIITVVGARPQFVKAAIVSRQLAQLPELDECMVHTGQHYDKQMSDVFFDQLCIPRPAYRLDVGSGTHGRQTARMLSRLEEVFERERPRAVVVYGDTNSTLAAALAAAKMHIPVAHVEAGLRSFNRRMPEETNRVITDHVSDLLLCPTQTAVDNLAREGIRDNVHLVGDVMYDAATDFSRQAEAAVDPLQKLTLQPGQYVLMTCHRAENTDDAGRLREILHAVNRIAKQLPVVFPIHPRTQSRIEACDTARGPAGLSPQSVLDAPTATAGPRVVEPLSYFDMLSLERQAAMILTDSGGVQKEAFIFGVPCVTIRDETEWLETIESGANVLVDASSDAICEAVESRLHRSATVPDAASWYGGGEASRRTADLVKELAQQPTMHPIQARSASEGSIQARSASEGSIQARSASEGDQCSHHAPCDERSSRGA